MAMQCDEAYLYLNPAQLNPTDPAAGAALMMLPIGHGRPTARPARSRRARRLAQHWDLFGVLALMFASAGASVYSLLHLI